MAEDLDVIIVGAGISGVCAAYYLKKLCCSSAFKILEGRSKIGGTWDLFKYPGVRSDSNIYTFGFSFYPWHKKNLLAFGSDILEYLAKIIEKFNINENIEFNRKVVSANWDSRINKWNIIAVNPITNGKSEYTCNFFYICSGYYDYNIPYKPSFKGEKLFKGEIIHPQHWREDTDYEDKRIILIGSGATSVTLFPKLAEKAKHVTMLQRSPGYIYTVPMVLKNRLFIFINKVLPRKLGCNVIRAIYILEQDLFFYICRIFPSFASRLIKRQMRRYAPEELLNSHHFTPNYKIWDQRLCVSLDGDYFNALEQSNTDIITDNVESFTRTGIKLKSNKEIKADMVVIATGLNLLFLGGIKVYIDGRAISPDELVIYNSFMFSDVPNLFYCFGYINSSWTLRAEISSKYVCRMINYIKAKKLRKVTPVYKSNFTKPFSAFTSGYLIRGMYNLPRQGRRHPWTIKNNYYSDLLLSRFYPLRNKNLIFD